MTATTEILRSTEEVPLQPARTVLEGIQARLREIHGEPEGHNNRICEALMIGSSAVRAQVQV